MSIKVVFGLLKSLSNIRSGFGTKSVSSSTPGSTSFGRGGGNLFGGNTSFFLTDLGAGGGTGGLKFVVNVTGGKGGGGRGSRGPCLLLHLPPPPPPPPPLLGLLPSLSSLPSLKLLFLSASNLALIFASSALLNIFLGWPSVTVLTFN